MLSHLTFCSLVNPVSCTFSYSPAVTVSHGPHCLVAWAAAGAASRSPRFSSHPNRQSPPAQTLLPPYHMLRMPPSPHSSQDPSEPALCSLPDCISSCPRPRASVQPALLTLPIPPFLQKSLLLLPYRCLTGLHLLNCANFPLPLPGFIYDVYSFLFKVHLALLCLVCLDQKWAHTLFTGPTSGTVAA